MGRFARLFKTSTFQLTLLYTCVFAASVAIVAAFLYWRTVGYLQSQTDAAIEAEVQALAEHYRTWRLPGLVSAIRERLETDPASGALYLFADRDFNPLAGNLARWPELAGTEDGWYSFRLQRGQTGSGVPARARVYLLTPRLILLVGREVSDLDQIVSIFVQALGWGGGIALVLSLAGGFAMSLSVERRVEQINAGTRRIIASDLSTRLPTRGSGDEFDQLAENFNTTIDELARLVDGMRHVGDGIAHDLRTPLTRLHNALDEAAREEHPKRAKARVLEATEAAEGLLATFNALLSIARIESDRRELHTRVELLPVVNDVVELYQVVAEERDITLSGRCEPGCAVAGDRELIFQLLVNLVDNAVKYTPAGGHVNVAGRQRLEPRTNVADDSTPPAAARVSSGSDREAAVELVVSDDGPGIPEGERHRVLDRFYRLDRARQEPGNGLGLSLVRAIAQAHRARLELDDAAPGLIVRVVFARVS